MNKVAVILRADKHIATGHLMRVNTIISNLKDCEFTLLSTSLDSTLRSLCTLYKDVLVKSLSEIQDYINKDNFDLVIIDDYDIDASFESQIYDKSKILIIDDLANREHKAHMLVDPCLVRCKEDYAPLVNQDCILLINKDYAYIKESFANIARNSSKKDDFKVLVSYGGADPVGACKLTLDSIIKGSLYKKYKFVFLTGKANNDFDYIQKTASLYDNIEVLKHTDNVPELFSKVDLAIGAYGGMFNERICAKLPSICVTIADNQVYGLASLNKYQIGLNCNLDEVLDYKNIENKLDYLSAHYQFFLNNCSKVYDGKGIDRICTNIYKYLLNQV